MRRSPVVVVTIRGAFPLLMAAVGRVYATAKPFRPAAVMRLEVQKQHHERLWGVRQAV
jgi:hypothetical protein